MNGEFDNLEPEELKSLLNQLMIQEMSADIKSLKEMVFAMASSAGLQFDDKTPQDFFSSRHESNLDESLAAGADDSPNYASKLKRFREWLEKNRSSQKDGESNPPDIS